MATKKTTKKPAAGNKEFGPFTIVQIDCACAERFRQDYIEKNGKAPANERAYEFLSAGIKSRMRLEMLRILKSAMSPPKLPTR